MVNPQMVMYEEEFNQIQVVVDRLVRDANAKVVFIVDKNGQLIAASGDIDNVDTTSLASLTAGNIAATGGMAKLLKEQEFATQFHEGEKANIHIQLVGNRVILVVIFDAKSSLGLVRLRVKKASEELDHIFESLLKKVQEPGADSPFAENHRRGHRQPLQRLRFNDRSYPTTFAGAPLPRQPMSFINYMAREINCKLVYYGPGLCGKTTNLQYIYERTNPDHKGKMISLATETERTLFFDFLPLSLGEIRGFKTRFHLYTVPGQVFYDASRKLILKGVDGVIFVADSQIERMEANEESIENLRTNLAEQGYNLEKLPFVIQYNKRDLPNVAASDELRQLLNKTNVPDFDAVARTGVGVFDTLKAVAKLVLTELKKGGGG